MRRFPVILTFLLFTITLVGCETPLIDIKIGETLSGMDSGGGCRRPCRSGGAKANIIEKSDESVKIIAKRVLYYVAKDDHDLSSGPLVSYEANPKQANFEEGQKVKITRDGNTVKITLVED